MEALYRAAVGPKNADYYVSRFLRFDEPGASKWSWHWPAFFIGFYWGLYRRMYGNALIYCLLVPFCIGVCVALALVLARITTLTPLRVVMLTYSWILIPIFANSIYHKFIARRIKEVQAKVPDPAVQIVVLENGPHTNNLAWIVVLVLLVPMIGILAAIAIPAYQDYTIRSQISEGLMLSGPIKDAVAAEYGTSGTWPRNLSALKGSVTTTGSYVTDISVDNGTISIRYGNQANSLIAGQLLSLRPTTDNHEVIWSCGYTVAGGSDPVSGPAGSAETSISKRFLPSACRG
jgi:Tfp pilus assembly major pilin PilA